VQENGLAALAVPPAEGFHLLGWIMPFVALSLGLAAVAVFIKRFRKPQVAVVTASPQIDENYRKRIEQELADLD
jgi:hypothetical protein